MFLPRRRLLRIILLLAFLIPALAGRGAGAAARVGSLEWAYQLDFSASSAGLARQQVYDVSPGLHRLGVTTHLQAVGGENYRLYMSGSLGADQLRQVLFSPLLAGFLEGPVELEISLPPSSRADVTLRLEANLSTGYRWEARLAGFTQAGPAEFMTRSRGYGVPGIQTLVIRSQGRETGPFSLAYRRPFGPEETVTRRVQIRSTEPLDYLDLTNPNPRALVPALAPPGELPRQNPFTLLPASSPLAASLDWRLAGIVPPVRNQGPCGSCWAFGTVGIMESALARIGVPMANLSEQFLVSCNTAGWNCDVGGLTAHKWHYDTLAVNQGFIGAVLEADKPYTATNGSCAAAYDHPYALSGWQFIVPDEWTMPTIEQIKTAISLYGPVTAGVCAGPHFQEYTGGIFTTNESCGGWTNHQIILVGWQDTSSTEGYWILRNSWGAWWGENGYMRIGYNTSRVGEGTSWVMSGKRYYFPWISR